MAKIVNLYPQQQKIPRLGSILPSGLGDLKEILTKEFQNGIKTLAAEPESWQDRKRLSTREVAKILHISVSSVRLPRQSGNIPVCCIDGEIYCDPSDVDRELRRRKRTYTA